MILKHYIPFCCVILFSSFVSPSHGQDLDAMEEEIDMLTSKMKGYFENGYMDSIGMLYHKNAYMLTPDETINGRRRIAGHWKAIKKPVQWEIETMEASLNEDDIYQDEYYQALNNKPPGWRQRGIELDDDKPRIFHLGHSALTTLNEDGEEQTSNVDFIIVWQVQPDGTYQILMDTYTWQ